MLPSSSITFSRRTSLARPMGAGINIRYERPHINYFIADSRVRPDLTDADALMWIERRLRDPHLGEAPFRSMFARRAHRRRRVYACRLRERTRFSGVSPY